MVGVGKDLTDHCAPTPFHEQGHLPLEGVPQSPSQPGLGNLQRWEIHSLSGKHAQRDTLIYSGSNPKSLAE